MRSKKNKPNTQEFSFHIKLFRNQNGDMCLIKRTNQRDILVLLFCLILLIFNMSKVDADEKNINKLLNNQAVVSRQIMCILEKSPCDQLGRQLKAALPEVITRKCRNCSPQQAQSAQKLTAFLQARYPDVWAMLLRKYSTA